MNSKLLLTKVCSKCKAEKPINEFYKGAKGKDGLHSWCKECDKAWKRAYYRRNQPRMAEQQHTYKNEIKRLVLTHYGNGELACVQCAFNDMRALTIDHIKGGGTKHRRALGVEGERFYRWLKKNGFPEGYQTLCMNCQLIKKEETGEH